MFCGYGSMAIVDREDSFSFFFFVIWNALPLQYTDSNQDIAPTLR